MISLKTKIIFLSAVGVTAFLVSFLKEAKQDEYFKTCRDTATRIFKALNPNALNGLIRDKSNESCQALVNYANENNAWKYVTNPKLQGCTNIIIYLAEKEAPKDLIQGLQIKYCAKYVKSQK